MVTCISIDDYYKNHKGQIPIIDVRSPSEFQKGQIPGAISIPLFSDDERAHVGTIYKQESRENAIALAYNYVNPRLSSFIEDARRVAPEGKVAVYCWRGGMRSESFAEHLSNNGFADVYRINKGYKAYRNYVLDGFTKPYQLKVIGGYTGSGKTYILKHLQMDGHQIVDLEQLANHKGSAFGWMGEQPTVEQLENNLFEELRTFNLSKPVWVEDESHAIGKVFIPLDFYNRMLISPLYFMEIPRSIRADLLVRDYSSIPYKQLHESIIRISKRLGGLETKQALQYLGEENYHKVALITLHYYDKAYLKGMRERPEEMIHIIKSHSTDPSINAKLLLKHELHEQH